MKQTISALLTSALVSLVAFGADTPPAGVELVDLTGSGKGSASSMYTSGWTDGSGATAFDDNFDNRSIYNSQTCDWRWTFNEPTVVNAYKLYAPKSSYYYYDQRMPKNFRLEAKNADDADWTTLDTRSNETALLAAKGSHYYECFNSTAYDTYRIVSTATIEGGSGYTQLAEIELFHVPSFCVSNAAMTAPANGSATLTGTAVGGSGTIKAVFTSTTDSTSVEVPLGTFSDSDAVNVAIDAATAGLSLAKFYTVKLVCTADDLSKEVPVSGTYYFGALSKASDMARNLEISVGNGLAEVLGDATLTDIPVPVRLSSGITGFAYSDFQTTDYSDIAFTDADGNELAYEVDTWDTTGTSIVWVKIPSLNASTTITCWYGGNLHVNTPSDVWSGFVGVWHMNGGSGVETDATGHGLDGTPTGSKLAEMTASSSAVLGAARVNQTSSGKYNRLSVPNYNAYITSQSVFTLSGWFKSTDKSGYPRPLSRKSGYDQSTGWEIQYDSNSDTSVSARGSNGTGVTLAGPSVTADWVYLTFVFNEATETTYANGGASKKSGTIAKVATRNDPMAIGNNINGSEQGWCGMYDEVRMYNGAQDDTRIAVDYYTGKNADAFVYGAARATDDTAPELSAPTIVRNTDGSYTVRVEISENLPVSGSVACVIGDGEYAMTTSDATLPQTYSATLSDLAADQTCVCTVTAESTAGTVVTKAAPSAFYTGDISVAKVADAVEDGLVAGSFRISRADTANDLAVVYTVSGTATAGQTYETLSGTAVIPAGAAYVDIAVTPKMDSATTDDTTVSLALSEGLYGIDANAAAATLTIVNLVVPTGWNTWIAPADGNASDASNWSNGHAPLATESVLFDGRFSTAKCLWDAAATHTVAAWKQENGYTGTIEFYTEFPDYSGVVFPLFTVTGDCDILSGTWTHRGNYNNYVDGSSTEKQTQKLASKRWCLNVSIGGDLTIASGASIDATGKGFGHQGNQNAGCYGGYAFDNAANAPYGSITEPFDPGMGCRSQGDQNSKRSGIGGGAVKLAVVGDVIVDGSILAVGNGDINVARSGASGGSIWIDASQISGSGTLNASACPTSYYTSDMGVCAGSGGRIALYTDTPLALSRDRILCSGTGYSTTSASSKTKIGSAGTIFLKDDTMPNGVLVLKQTSTFVANSAKSAVPLMGDLTLDAIELSGRVILAVEEGTTLTLPNGLASVTSSATTVGINGISYRGGTIAIGNGNQTIAGWMFEPVAEFTFPANVSLKNYGSIGIVKRNICGTGDAPIPPRKVLFAVNGDLTIDETSAINVSKTCGYTHYVGGKEAGQYGGWTTYYNGSGNSTQTRLATYGSVFDPFDFGSSPTRSMLAGGAVKATVAGTLTLNGGAITSDSIFEDNTTDNAAPASGGSINLTVGALSGEGKITATGGNARYAYAGAGGGGRIAVKLTNRGAAIPSTIAISAKGGYGYAFNAKATKLGSAGTVYIETADDAANGGDITIANWADHAFSEFTSATVFPTTPIIGYVDGDAVSTFKRANLVVENYTIAEVSTNNLMVEVLEVKANASIDLNGNNFRVLRAKFGGTTLPCGVFHVSDYPAYLCDSSDENDATGTLTILGEGTVLLFR